MIPLHSTSAMSHYFFAEMSDNSTLNLTAITSNWANESATRPKRRNSEVSFIFNLSFTPKGRPYIRTPFVVSSISTFYCSPNFNYVRKCHFPILGSDWSLTSFPRKAFLQYTWELSHISSPSSSLHASFSPSRAYLSLLRFSSLTQPFHPVWISEKDSSLLSPLDPPFSPSPINPILSSFSPHPSPSESRYHNSLVAAYNGRCRSKLL